MRAQGSPPASLSWSRNTNVFTVSGSLPVEQAARTMARVRRSVLRSMAAFKRRLRRIQEPSAQSVRDHFQDAD
jgi:hypothetical protein